MRQLLDDVIEAVKQFENRNPGVFVNIVDFDNGRNLTRLSDGSLKRINYQFDVDLTGDARAQSESINPP